jgi:acetate---CoA ligase (ADP-forming)
MAAGVDVALRDGSTVRLRPAGPDDFDAVRAFLEGLSEKSRWLRFFGAANLDDAATVAVQGRYSVSLIAVTGGDSHVVGHGMYVRERPGDAEVAFAVADDWQGHGIATILLAQLADAAASEGIHTFTAIGAERRRHCVFLRVRSASNPRCEPTLSGACSTYPSDLPQPEAVHRRDIDQGRRFRASS